MLITDLCDPTACGLCKILPAEILGIAAAGFLVMPDAVLDTQLQVSQC